MTMKEEIISCLHEDTEVELTDEQADSISGYLLDRFWNGTLYNCIKEINEDGLDEYMASYIR